MYIYDILVKANTNKTVNCLISTKLQAETKLYD